MKKLLRKTTSFLMALFMILQVMLPAFSSTSRAEDENPNMIKGLEEIKNDTDLNISIKKSQEIYDKKKTKKDENKFSIALSMPDDVSKVRLIKRNDLSLFEDKHYDTNEQASKEYWHIKDMLNDQGLDIDLEIINDDQGYKILTKEDYENLEKNKEKSPYGQNYSYIDFKIMDDFDFNKKGNQKLLNEDKLVFNLEFFKNTSPDPNFNLYEKDEEGNLEIKKEGDIFALVCDDKKSLYDTKNFKEEYDSLQALKEEKTKQAQEQKDKQEKEKAEKQEEEIAKKQAQEQKDKKETKKEENKKESKTEIKVSSGEISSDKKENEKQEEKDKNNNKDKNNKEENKTPIREENEQEVSLKKENEKELSSIKKDKKEKTKTEKRGFFRNFRSLLFGEERVPEPVGQGQNGLNLDGKKFHILTRFDTSNANGPIQPGQFFNIHLDKQLTVKPTTKLEPIRYKGDVIAEPKYNSKDNIIEYKIVKEIKENTQIPLNIPVDYNAANVELGKDGTFTVINKVSGLGLIDPPKDLLPQKVDVNGNLAGSIIEPGRDDVTEIIEPDGSNYKLATDAVANPVIKDGELIGYNWTIRVSSDTDLDLLGYKANFTIVKGSGFGEIEDKSSQGLTDQLQNATGIVDSKHHSPAPGIREITYNFYTPITEKQEKYMFDLSVVLTKKTNKVGAKRIVIEQGWPHNKVKEETPNRVGMNNRTTVFGEFTSENNAKWTITDAISTGDKETKLPLETRKLGNQTFQSGQVAVYGLNEKGEMVQIGTTSSVTSIPDQGKNPGDKQAVGNIAVYEYKTSLNKNKNPLSLAGVEISKYQDVNVEQHWNLGTNLRMPKMKVQAVYPKNQDNVLGEEETTQSNEKGPDPAIRKITIPDVKVWNIDNTSGKFSKNDLKIKQIFPTDDKDDSGNPIYYYETNNWYDFNKKGYYVHNSATVEAQPKFANFTLIKKGEDDKPLEGATFKLLGSGEAEITTDKDGKISFTNIAPGNYRLVETEAPKGYKLKQETTNVYVDNNGRVSISGSSAKLTVGENPTVTVAHQTYPDYMNAMQYAKVEKDGSVTTYIFLKANSAKTGKGTNRDTRLSLRVADGIIEKQDDVKVYDVNPDSQRGLVKNAMTQQLVNQNLIGQLGESVLNRPNDKPIVGTQNHRDPYTNKTGYEITFPKERFIRDWGFLVVAKSKPTNGGTPTITYDWLTSIDTANQANLQNQTITPTSGNGSSKETTITINNEKFETRPVEITKLDKDEKGVAGASFVLKDEHGNVISTVTSENDGKASFGDLPKGKYTIEETHAPDGYVKSDVIFEVEVDESKQVTYKPKYKDGSGTPVNGEDYLIKEEEQSQEKVTAKVTKVSQSLKINEGDSGDIGVRPQVWEAYRLESLKYNLYITVENSGPGQRFSIQFDRNLDFTQYFGAFPKLNFRGVDVAEPYFDYTTNKLTYVFNENSVVGQTNLKLELKGIIPSKYFAQNDGTYNFTVTVAPGQKGVEGQQTITTDVKADYEQYDYDNKNVQVPQSYYFRDVYKDDKGDWYVAALAYYNPVHIRTSPERELKFNWMSTNYQGADKNFFTWEGNGNKPAFSLRDVKIYRTSPNMGKIQAGNFEKRVNYNMPLSYGVRPSQDPAKYNLVYSRSIDPRYAVNNDRQGSITLNYNPSQIQDFGVITKNSPLRIKMPAIDNRSQDGYIIEQTFKIDDLHKFNNLWRVFLMQNGDFKSSFITRANYNKAITDQAGKKIPKFYSQKVALINKKYTPGQFKIKKLDESDRTKTLSGASFSLEDENKNKIYRSSGADGIVDFTNLKPGIYTLREEKAPADHIKSDKIWRVNVGIDGQVTIIEIGLGSTGHTLTGENIELEVTNKPVATDFIVYKRDNENVPLQGAEFKITKADDGSEVATGSSDKNGLVKFSAKLEQGTYILEETKAPAGYKKLDKKWVVEVGKDNKAKVYNYIEGPKTGTDTNVNKSILGVKGTNWVDVAKRPLDGWILGDNRQTGYFNNYPFPFKLGTRIVGINTKDKYVIQRYVINPEAQSMILNDASIHREKPNYTNMDWYTGNESYKIFELDKAVDGNVEDIRLENYKLTDITNQINVTKSKPVQDQPDRLHLNFKNREITKPIVIDVKVPYKAEDGGVGTGMDLQTNKGMFWKSDYYDRVNQIVEGEPVVTGGSAGNIKGAYISEGSLEVTNEKVVQKFSFKKVDSEKENDGVTGATFKLQGPKINNKDLGSEVWKRSGKDGMVNFDNLTPGIYKLTEAGAAQGYEKSNTDWTVTVTNDGKIYIRDNNQVNTVPDQGAQWQKVKAGTKGTVKGWTGVQGTPVANRLDTRITEVNKKENKFRQVYIINKLPETLKNPYFEIHAQEENRPLNLSNTQIVSLIKVGRGSTPDNLISPGAKVEYDTQVYVKNNNQERIKITPKNLAGDQALALTIESTLGNSGNVGTGMDFVNYDGYNKYWMAEYYEDFSKIQLEPAQTRSADKNSRTLVGDRDISGRQSVIYPSASPKPVLYSNSGLMERSFGFNRLRTTDPKDLDTTFETRSSRLTTFAGGLEIGDELVGTPVAAGDGWEKVVPDKSEGRTGKTHTDDYMETKVTEINKGADRFKQIFIFRPKTSNFTGKIEIHREPEKNNYQTNDLYIKQGRNVISTVKFYEVDSSSTVNNIVNPRTVNIRTSNNRDGSPSMRIKADLPKGKTIMVEVETYYAADRTLGLGADYQFQNKPFSIHDKTKYKSWACDSYANEDGVNKNLAQGPKKEVKEEEVRKTLPIPDKAERRPNAKMKKGEEKQVFAGEEGYQIDIYKVTYIDGVKQPNPEYVRTKEKVDPKPRIIEYGTKDEAQPQPQDYRVNTIPVDHGSVSAPLTAKSGSTVEVDIHPDPNYEIDKIEVLHNRTGQILTTVNISTRTFTMPANDVALKAYFKPISTPQPSEYTIEYAPTTNGTVTGPTSAKPGAGVKLTVTPDQGYEIESIKVVDENDIKAADVWQPDRSFNMPAKNVTVKVTFREIPRPTYYVYKDSDTRGYITINNSNVNGVGVKVGDKVNFKVTAHQNYKVTGARAARAPYGGAVDDFTFDPATGLGSFTMPDSNVTVTGLYTNKPAGERTDSREITETLKHETKVTVDESLAPGERKVDKAGKDGEVKTKYSVTYNVIKIGGQTEDSPAPADWPTEVVDAFKASKKNNEIITAYKKDEISRTDPVTEEVRVGKSDNPVDTWTPGAEDKLIKDGEVQKLVKITNKKAGINLKIIKRATGGTPLEGATFEVEKYTDEKYENLDTSFGKLTATSDSKGNVKFTDQAGNGVKLKAGYYLLKETKAPTGYKKFTANWKIQVKDDGGRMYAVYQGPEDTPSSLINDNNKSNAGSSKSNDIIKYKARLTYIDPERKTYIQRIYIDTRAYYGNETEETKGKLNLQITPKYKREEIDTPGKSPKTIKEGVKTAYYQSYKLSDPENFTDMNDPKIDKILRTYDLSKDNVSLDKTARWRPFDWGFDEDQLNLGKGVYMVEVEGFYDDVIITGKSTLQDKYNIPEADRGKIDLHVDFYQGERHFKQLVYDKKSDKFTYKAFKGASFQGGVETLRKVYEDRLYAYNLQLGYNEEQAREKAKKKADAWAKEHPEGKKYANFVARQVELEGKTYDSGKIDPPLGTPFFHGDTSINLKPLYESKKSQEIPRTGMEIENQEETYNITFSKHGREDINDDVNGKEVTKNRLEGAIFRLEVRGPGGQYEPIPGTTVASAFNGYFGFRGLKPGRYRLVEVKAPPGYTPIKDPVLHFTIAYEKPKTNVQTGEITPGRGVITLEYNESNGIFQYAPDNKDITPESGRLVDYVTSATAKNMGKIINERPGKGEVTLTKYDGENKLLEGAEFKLTRLSRQVSKEEDPNKKEGEKKDDGIYTKTVGNDGKLVFDQLPIGQYELEETKSPNGYQNKGKKWRFTVGGAGLDPYIGDSDEGKRDISKNIEMTSTMSVIRPDGDDGTEKEGNSKIHPHKGHALEFKNTFKIKDDTVIKPGDYFKIKLTDNIDLEGIMRERTQGLDLFADGIGTIAKAKYDKKAGTLTYVFTSYAEQYSKTDFANTITAHINLFKVKNSSQNEQVGMGIKDTNFTKNNIEVVYELDMAKVLGLNMTSKIVSFDRETGEFVQYFYINRDRQYVNDPLSFKYKPSEKVNNLKFDILRLDQNGTTYNYYTGQYYYSSNEYINRDMPESFGVDENSNNISTYRTRGPYNKEANEDVEIPIGTLGPYNSMIVKVTGKVDKKDIASYDTYAKMYNKVYTYDRYGRTKVLEQPYVERTNGVRIFENKTTASAKLELNAINPKNEIIFKKVDQEGKILQGAKFKLERYYEKTQDGKNWVEVQGSEKTSDKDGLVKYEKLEPGRYALIETEAPKGYGKLEGHILEFTVGDDGVITRQVPKAKENPEKQGVTSRAGNILKAVADKITGSGESETVTENVSKDPIEVVNYKDVEFEKIDAEDESKKLENAEFDVYYKEKEEGEYAPLTTKADGGKEVTMKVKSGNDGKFKLNLKKPGFYALKETKAPAGYSKIPGWIKEFKLENGKVQVLEKDPIKASLRTSTKGKISSQIISVDKDKKTFKQRIIINPNHEEMTIPFNQSFIRIMENNWKITPKYGKKHGRGIGGLVNVAVLTKDGEKKPDDLKETDFKEMDALSFTTSGNITGSRYGLKEMLGREDVNDTSITTTDSIVMEFTGKLDDNNTTGIADQLFELVLNVGIDDQVRGELNVESIASGKPAYADHDLQKPIQVENKKIILPKTNGLRAWIGFTIIGLILMLLAAYYYNKKKNKGLEVEKNS